jgi:hypothetical protein
MALLLMDRNDPLRIIAEHIACHGVPAVAALSEAEYGPNCHVFYFGDWADHEQVGLIFVNKNGNFFRLIKQGNGRWNLFKTWSGLFETEPWIQNCHGTS